jgi:hypothetical protein
MTTASYAVPFLNMAVSATPNARSTGPDAALREYGECLTVCFASLRRAVPDADLRLITNHPLPSYVTEPLKQWNVRTVIQPFTVTVPDALSTAFVGSLYYLDALRALETDVTVLLDPDVVCTAPLPPEVLSTSRDIGALPLNYQVDREVNGLSRAQTMEVLARLNIRVVEPPLHWGGECYVIPLARRDELLEQVTAVWADTLAHFDGPLPTCRTEEHLFNCALSRMGAEPLTGIVKRIWTTHRHRTVDGGEHTIPLWHLPAEKGRGFTEVSRQALDPSSWFWTSNDEVFRRRIAKGMGMSHRTPLRWGTDTLGQSANRILGQPR